MLKLYNTLSRRLEEFQALEPGHVRLYACGPTVHDYAHIGNFRTFVATDVLRRTLIRQGLRVTQVMNITDVEDKIIAKAQASGQPIEAITERFIAAFHADRRALRIEDAEHYPRATLYMEQMVALVETLLERNLAYRADGSIYFRVAALPGYGRLARISLDQLQSGGRVESDEYDKEAVQDFALWKGPREGEPSWDTRIGAGRPGWHLECSAMSMHLLGRSFDIHTGGKDLVFPHHVNEMAQSEGATGEEFVRYWMHVEWLVTGEEKMSKSLGNIVTVHELLEQGHDPRAVRYALLGAHYRKPLQFGSESLRQAARAIQGLDNLRLRLRTELADAPGGELVEPARLAVSEFDARLADDLNVPEGLAVLHTLAAQANRALDRGELGRADSEAIETALGAIDEVLALAPETGQAAPAEVQELAEQREQARKQRDWSEADRLRDAITELGWQVEDTREGPRLKPV